MTDVAALLRQRRDNTPSPVNNLQGNAFRPRFFLRLVYIRLSMALTKDDIARIANLARLELSGSESERMLSQMNNFFGIVEKMQAVDTSGVMPLSHPVAAIQEISLRLRDDVISEPNNREANQRSAPAVEKGYFLVPKVIE